MTVRVSGALLAPLVLVTAAGAAPEAPAKEAPHRVTSPAQRSEEIRLDIAEKRISEQGFQATLEVETGGEALPWHLRIGGTVTAERVSLYLKNVRGRIRFRATLEPLLERLRSRGERPVVPEPQKAIPGPDGQ